MFAGLDGKLAGVQTRGVGQLAAGFGERFEQLDRPGQVLPPAHQKRRAVHRVVGVGTFIEVGVGLLVGRQGRCKLGGLFRGLFEATAQQIRPAFLPLFKPLLSASCAAGHTPMEPVSDPPGSLPHFFISQQFSFAILRPPFIDMSFDKAKIVPVNNINININKINS